MDFAQKAMAAYTRIWRNRMEELLQVNKEEKEMEKIQLTKEQADLIEGYKKRGISDALKFIEAFSVQDRFYLLTNQCLNNLSVEELSICLLVSDSYEVIPQYKVEDWVVFDNQYVSKITKISGKEKVFYLDIENERAVCGYVNTSEEYIRHATPEEIQQGKKRRFWDGLGREVDEWKDGDIVTHNGYFTNISVLDIQQGVARFPTYSDDEERIVPIQTVCLATPVEQRLDK